MEVLACGVVLVPLVVVEPAVPVELWGEVDGAKLDVSVEGSHQSLVALPLVGGGSAVERVGGVGLVAVAELAAEGGVSPDLGANVVEEARGGEGAVWRCSVGARVAAREGVVRRAEGLGEGRVRVGVAVLAAAYAHDARARIGSLSTGEGGGRGRNNIYHAIERAGAIDTRGRTFEHFYALDVFGRNWKIG